MLRALCTPVAPFASLCSDVNTGDRVFLARDLQALSLSLLQGDLEAEGNSVA